MRRRASGRRTPAVLVTLAVAIVVVVLAGYGTSALRRVWQMRQELERQEGEIATLRQRIEALSEAVNRLHSDPAYIEKLAREELGYVRNGETILKFPRQTPRP